MKTLPAISLLGLIASGNAMAVDYSVAIVSGGINLYSITKKAIHLVAGSPFSLPASILEAQGDPYPLTPVSLALSPNHEFVSVVFEQTPYMGNDDTDVIVAGFKITATGMILKWYIPFNMDPDSYPLTTVTAGTNYTILQTTPDPGGPNSASIINSAGEGVAGAGGPPGSNQLFSFQVDASGQFFYACYGPYGVTPAQSVDVYSLEPGSLAGTAPYPYSAPVLVITSMDPHFIQSVCAGESPFYLNQN
jgi:hypothetical protein